MATFVLVHGAWHGGWCWRKVEALLRRYGVSVYAPSLTGMGERSHLARYIDPAVINLDLHIKDVTELLESEGLERVILVGHAYGGRCQEHRWGRTREETRACSERPGGQVAYSPRIMW